MSLSSKIHLIWRTSPQQVGTFRHLLKLTEKPALALAAPRAALQDKASSWFSLVALSPCPWVTPSTRAPHRSDRRARDCPRAASDPSLRDGAATACGGRGEAALPRNALSSSSLRSDTALTTAVCGTLLFSCHPAQLSSCAGPW